VSPYIYEKQNKNWYVKNCAPVALPSGSASHLRFRNLSYNPTANRSASPKSAPPNTACRRLRFFFPENRCRLAPPPVACAASPPQRRPPPQIDAPSLSPSATAPRSGRHRYITPACRQIHRLFLMTPPEATADDGARRLLPRRGHEPPPARRARCLPLHAPLLLGAPRAPHRPQARAPDGPRRGRPPRFLLPVLKARNHNPRTLLFIGTTTTSGSVRRHGQRPAWRSASRSSRSSVTAASTGSMSRSGSRRRWSRWPTSASSSLTL
jgi:hypothetical protein